MKPSVLAAIFSISVLLAVFLHGCARPPLRQPESVSEQVSVTTTESEAPVPATEAPTEPTTVRNVDRSAESVYLAHPNLTPVDYDSPALLPECDDLGTEYIDRITFLVDSPMYWLGPFELLSGGADTTQVWTGPTHTMTLAYLRDFDILDPFDGQLRTIPETTALRKPDIMVITVGINGVAFMDEDWFKEEYIHLIDEIRAASPETTILLQSILPITPDYWSWGDITNDTITEANRWMLEICEQEGIHYLDAFSALIGEDGNAIAELMQSDGLHPNEEGLAKVLMYIRTHGYLPEKD